MNEDGIRKLYLLLVFMFFWGGLQAQRFMNNDMDTTVIMEYNNGYLWIYRGAGDFVVGMTNNEEQDDYGSYYQISIFVNNLGGETFTFNPEDISSTLWTKRGDSLALEVYTYDEYMKKVNRSQAWAMALTSFSAGLNAGTAGYSTSFLPNGMPISTYNAAAASAANMAAQAQIMTLGKMQEYDRKAKEEGYLRITTLHPNEAIVGYMNIKRKRGVSMTINIPVNGQVFSFDWDVTKEKKKREK